MREITQGDFGQHLKNLRKQRHFSQEYIAEMIGFSVQQIRKYEWGQDNPSPITIRKLCQILDISGDELLLLDRDPVLHYYEYLDPHHKDQIKENIEILLRQERKENLMIKNPLKKTKTLGDTNG